MFAEGNLHKIFVFQLYRIISKSSTEYGRSDGHQKIVMRMALAITLDDLPKKYYQRQTLCFSHKI